MFKSIISPVQAWLLSNGQCVGCSRPLEKGKKSPAKIEGLTKVSCKCGRVYFFDAVKKTYRRALMSEI